MAYASLKNAVTEATDPKGNTFCWNTFGPLVSGQKTPNRRQGNMLHRSWVSVYRHLTDPMSSHRGPPSVRSWPALRMMQQDTGRLGLRYAGIYERSLIVGNRGRTLDFCFTPNRRVKVEPSGRSSGLTSPSRKPLDTSVKVAANSALSSSVSPEDLTRIPDLPKSAAR